jgi:hypothetical protein
MRKSWLTTFIILVGVVLVSGCSFNVGYNLYDGNGISFKYPYSWDELSPDKLSTSNGTAQIIAAVANPETQQNGEYRTLVYIQRADLNMTMDQAMASNRAAIESSNANIVSEQDITVNGAPAKELNYTFNAASGVAKKERLIAFEKNNKRYYIICSAPVDEFDSQQSNFNQIINSFTVK